MIYAIHNRSTGAGISRYVQPKICVMGYHFYISLPNTQRFSTFQLQKSVKFTNFELTYEIISFKDIQICQTLRFQYLISNLIIQSIQHIQVSTHMDMQNMKVLN